MLLFLEFVLNLDFYVLLYLFISNLFLHVFEKYYDSFNFQVSTWNIECVFSLASFLVVKYNVPIISQKIQTKKLKKIWARFFLTLVFNWSNVHAWQSK